MNDIKEFFTFAESLKLNQKAELSDDKGASLISLVYTDLFPNNAINDKVNLPNTTIIIGRKGTGKSTIFQKSIEDQYKAKVAFPIYIDIKTIFDKATPTLDYKKEQYISNKEITKYLIYKNFLKEVIKEINKKIENFISSSFFSKYLALDTVKILRVQEQLSKIELNLKNVFEKIDISLFEKIGTELEKQTDGKNGFGFKLNEKPELSVNSDTSNSKKIKEQFNNVFLNYLNIKELIIDNFLIIKDILEVKNLYLYLDDFSEIDMDAQTIFIDWFIAPLNNLSENFFKFKIATYRGRLYLGKIDRSKIDFIHLDFFEAYNIYKNISKSEELALDYNGRLINNRCSQFFKKSNFYDFFDMKKEDLHELLFEISMNIPRKLGYILSYCYESNLIHDQKITKAALGNAAQRYYEEITESYFIANQYITRPFDDKINIASQVNLLEKIIDKQKYNKQNISNSSSKLFEGTDQPTSHFVVNEDFAPLLNNLELNGFLSTYNKIKDKSNISSTLFALDYGLCRKQNLIYGRPKDTEKRKYYSDSRFSLNHIIREHFNSTQVFKCNNGHEFSFDLKKNLEFMDMNCPNCLKEGAFEKVNLSVSSEEILHKIKKIEANSLINIDYDEFKILHSLSQFSPVSLPCKKLGQLTDFSYQYVTKRIPKLIELGLIEVDKEKSLALTKEHYLLTAKAKETIIDPIIERVKIRLNDINNVENLDINI
ncbi:MAG: hypothetical protein BGO40_10735 [Chryseobacterium sp. 39-10]|nr:hypothetical protein [Chryseobacterium sp.]OJV49675.1 MAG: hypothetical protein BGO40_10735 [Chryseobacterium sp. 39-10]